jgi:cell wall-associated NlpC family hydrolase
MKQQELAQRTPREIVLSDERRISTLYKNDYPGGTGPVLVTPRSVWWGTIDMVFRVDLTTNKREVYLPWAGGKGKIQTLQVEKNAVLIRTDQREARIQVDAPTFDGYVRVRLGDEERLPTTPANKKIAQTVEEWLGTPYLYGGDTKKGCDCSGFVGAMLKVAGKSIPRTTGEIAKSGKPVLGELRCGDVVCTPGHVTIYLGDGWQAEAPNTGDVVKKTTIWHRLGASARRFL